MISESIIHIVSFDIPSPPDYGGVIDVYYKIKYLYQKRVKIILHCFQYNNRTISEELERYCYKIYYYKRATSFSRIFHFLPYTVISRKSDLLLKHLLKDHYPILFETLHCTYYLSHPDLKNRIKILRLSNIEHHYYYHLFLSEKNVFKKFYFLTESIKLYFYEKKIFPHAHQILPVTSKDLEYTTQYYSNIRAHWIPSFHPFNDLCIWKGKGNYLLYHGNLSIPENYKTAEFLIDRIAPNISIPVIIAGKNPPAFLLKKSKKYHHVQIVANPDTEEMKQLIQNAHILWLYTHQATGLKLKLLYSLFSGRFIICNNKMIAGTSLQPNLSLYIKNTPSEIIESIHSLQEREFDDSAYLQRKNLLEKFDNEHNTQQLLKIIVSS